MSLIMSGGNWGVVKSGTLFQSSLSAFILLVGVIMTFFVVIVLMAMMYVSFYSGVSHYMSHKKLSAETFAFVFSSLALLIMGGPSMSLLYEYSSQTSVELIVKVVGSQWYWSWEISNLGEEVAMYMTPLEEMPVGGSRFLTVDNKLFIPTGMLVQFNVTSTDVIHSFALPTLGVKVDAMAGILTVVPVHTKKVGTHYGQCSEICGMNHSFMPFALEVSGGMSFFYQMVNLVA